MTTLAALPDFDFIPAPLWLITALHVLTLTLHLLAMNFMVGGLAVSLFGRIEGKWQNDTVKLFLKLFPGAMAATVTLGIAPLLFVQLVYGRQVYAASIVSAWFWFAIPIVVILAYYFLYGAAFARQGNPKVRGWLLVAFLGLLYVSVIYSGVFSLAEDPALQQEVYRGAQDGLVFNPDLGAWLPRWLHMMTAAITVGAFFFGWIAKDDPKAFAAARGFYLYGFVVASVVGIVYLLTLDELLRPFMRSSGIWSVMIGLLFGLGALHFFFRRKFWIAGLFNLLSVLLMVAARHVLRQLALQETFDPATAWRVSPQWGVFAIFLVCFVVAIALVIYMVRLFLKDEPAPSA